MPSVWTLLSGGIFATAAAWGMWVIAFGPISTPAPLWIGWQLVILAAVRSIIYFGAFYPNPSRLLAPFHPRFMWFIAGRRGAKLRWMGALCDVARLAPLLLEVIGIGPGRM